MILLSLENGLPQLNPRRSFITRPSQLTVLELSGVRDALTKLPGGRVPEELHALVIGRVCQ